MASVSLGLPSNNLSREMSEDSMMARIKAAQERVKREQTLPPTPLPMMPPQVVILKTQLNRKSGDDTPGQNNLRHTLIGDPKYCSEERNLTQLQRIEISDFQVRKVHRGRYLLCRIASLPSEIVGLYVAVVSPNGSAIQLALYNFVVQPISLGLAKPLTYDAALPEGTILAIKEPFVKMGSQGDFPFVRVDSPSDVIVLPSSDPLLRNISWEGVPSGKWHPPLEPARGLLQWKDIGNHHFKAGRFFEAERCYLAGVGQHPSHEDCFLLNLNRAAVLLKLERYSEALLAAESVICHLDPNGSAKAKEPTSNLAKALYRKAVALYSLRQWKPAQKAFLHLDDSVSSSQAAATGLCSCEKRITEARTGDYDFLSLFKQAQLPKPRPDAADFVGPVEVRGVAGKGRGVFATRDIKPGEILLATKAFVAVFNADLPPKSEWSLLSMNLLTNRQCYGSQTLLPRMVSYRLQHQPAAANQVYRLYHGQKTHSISYDLHSEFQVGDDETWNPIINPAQIDAICSFNAFGLLSPTRMEFPETPHPVDKGSGLFLQTSLFNHSCVPNATWVCFGDFQFIKATVPINKGAEISITYIANDLVYLQRQAKLRNHFSVEKFECECERCKSDLADGSSNVRKREKLIEEDKKVEKKNILPVDTALPEILHFIRYHESLIASLDATFSQSRKLLFRPEMFCFHQRLSRAYGLLTVAVGDPALIRKAMAEDMKALQVCGVQFRPQKKVNKSRPPSYLTPSTLPITSGPIHNADEIVTSTAQLALNCRGLGEENNAKAWLQSAVWMEDITIGGGVEMFRERFGSMLKAFNLEKYLD